MKEITMYLEKNATLQEYIQFVYNGWLNGYKSYDVAVVYINGKVCMYSFPIYEKMTFSDLKTTYNILFTDNDNVYVNFLIKLRHNDIC